MIPKIINPVKVTSAVNRIISLAQDTVADGTATDVEQLYISPGSQYEIHIITLFRVSVTVTNSRENVLALAENDTSNIKHTIQIPDDKPTIRLKIPIVLEQGQWHFLVTQNHGGNQNVRGQIIGRLIKLGS